MISENIRLKVVGIMSNNLLFTFGKLLSFDGKSIDEVVLFCDYSSFDVPIGYSFKTIQDSNASILYSGSMILVSVTQAYAIAYDSIPKGDKTICMFKFPNTNVPNIIYTLPIVTGWYSSDKCLFLE
jgi:hypothetical protein